MSHNYALVKNAITNKRHKTPVLFVKSHDYITSQKVMVGKNAMSKKRHKTPVLFVKSQDYITSQKVMVYPLKDITGKASNTICSKRDTRI